MSWFERKLVKHFQFAQTWTPTWGGAFTVGSLSHARYIKIGKLFMFSVAATGTFAASLSGTMTLPYTVAYSKQIATGWAYDNTGGHRWQTIHMTSSSATSTMTFYKDSYVNFAVIANTGEVRINGWYIVQ